ncbi:hypothetical protein Aspvir_000186 [Aspergillus viridinutans]|uniref:Uncharacterized protein n=1 Tax=Aspergillus viridinutans TaxID=75553 RepID=A0A9P3EYB4_ASPVI|nr:uncharacterized protein Aspvir_000186 [Aspergillus viridinutans]GIJ98076.1 hypothetical protein Aspvir_000186 [Aspergillus viridinutans]
MRGLSFKKIPWRVRSEKRSSQRVDKSRSGDGLSKSELLATAPQDDDLWLKAELLLKKNEKTSRILAAATEILEADFRFQVPSNALIARDQICSFLDAQARELEEKKWVVTLGGHSIEVEDRLTRTFRNVLIVKDIIHTAAAASPPAAVACAGVMLVVQAVEQHESLLRGLETTSALIPRLHLMEDLYLQHPNAKVTARLRKEFSGTLTLLYSKVIEFQARAICYLRNHSVSRLFRNMFKQDGWNDLVQDMQRLETNAQSFASVIEPTVVREKLDSIEKAFLKDQIWRTTSTRDEKAKQFFKLLYTCPYRDRKDRNSKRVPGTCEWFTSHSRFQKWEHSDQSGLLWVTADPGCGKSVLTKFLVDDFLPSHRRTVCYFFFKDDFPDQRSAANALSAILRQLFMAQPHLLPDSVLEKQDTDGDKLVGSFNDLWGILTSVASHLKAGEIICALDALDECPEDDRKQLIQALKILYSEERLEKHKLKFLVTSRPYDHIRRGFQELEDKVPTIHLSGEGEVETQEISREIDLVIKKRVADIGKQNDLRPDECLYLQQQLTSVRNRTYLWVSLTLDVIENMSGFTKGNIRQTVRNLPQNVDEAYDRILNRTSDKAKARKLLHIITAAERPLSLRELSLAMAFSTGHRSIPDILDEHEKDDKRFERSIRDLCGLFLVVIGGKVYLLHQTAKEFLVGSSQSVPPSPNDSLQSNTWKHCLKSEESHKILAHTCMSYLIHDTTADSLHYFLEYAAWNWPSHFRRAFAQYDHEAAELGSKLCRSGSKVYETWFREYRWQIYIFPRAPTTLLMASYLGLAAVVKLHLDTEIVGLDSKDSTYGRTPLSWAAWNGHEAVMKLLLDTEKVDVNSRDSEYGRTPLSWAAGNGHEAVMKLLLDTEKVDVNSRDSEYGQTPLSWAAKNGYTAVVKLLLDNRNVDVDSRSSDSQTPLSLAAKNGHEAVVKLLLDTKKVDVNSRNSTYGRTSLSWAAGNGHEAVVKLLLDNRNVDVDSRNSDGQTPLSLAVENGREVVMKLLLDTGKVDVNSRDSDGQTPLSWAAKWGYKAAVKLLLDTGKVDVNSRDSDGWTPLLWAASKWHEAVVKLLLDTGKADVNSRNSAGQTPLSFAIWHGHEGVVKLLLDTGKVDVNSRDSKGQTPLSWAVKRGYEALLDTEKVDVDSWDSDGQMPLSAAENRHEAVIKLLLDTGKVDVNSRDADGQTPLSWAAKRGYEAAVKLLLDTGKVDINSRDSDGQTPLSLAAENGDGPVVTLLENTGIASP